MTIHERLYGGRYQLPALLTCEERPEHDITVTVRNFAASQQAGEDS